MAAPDYKVLVFVTRTGAVVDELPVIDWTPEDSIDWANSGSLSVDVPLAGRTAATAVQIETVRSIDRAGWTYGCCLVRDQRAIWAGPAISVDFDTEKVSIDCVTIDQIFERRMVIADGYYGNPMSSDGNVALTLVTRDLVIELVTRGMTGLRRDLPIDVPAQSGTTGPGVEYLAADLKTVHEAVKDVVDRDDGPDVYLRPYLSLAQDQVRWSMEVGTPLLGSPTSVAVFDFPGSITSLTGTTDASECVSTAYVIGDSTSTEDAPRLIGVHVLDRGDPHPALERADRTSSSASQLDTLTSLAESYGAMYAEPVRSWKVSVRRDVPPLYADEWQVGDVITLSVSEHPYVADGQYVQRVIGVSGEDAEDGELTVELQDPPA